MSKYFKAIKSYEDLKNQYKNLLKANHPDNGGDLEVMKEINVEYDALFTVWKNKKEVETGEEIKETADSTRTHTSGPKRCVIVRYCCYRPVNKAYGYDIAYY